MKAKGMVGCPTEWAWLPARDGTALGKELAKRALNSRGPKVIRVEGVTPYRKSKNAKHLRDVQLARFEDLFEKSAGRKVR